MPDRYCIKCQNEELYVHFDPHTGVYFVGNKLLGAVVFPKVSGSRFLENTKLSECGQIWELVPINPSKTITAPRSQEIRAFDSTH